jgi:hypothetical protein
MKCAITKCEGVERLLASNRRFRGHSLTKVGDASRLIRVDSSLPENVGGYYFIGMPRLDPFLLVGEVNVVTVCIYISGRMMFSTI